MQKKIYQTDKKRRTTERVFPARRAKIVENVVGSLVFLHNRYQKNLRGCCKTQKICNSPFSLNSLTQNYERCSIWGVCRGARSTCKNLGIRGAFGVWLEGGFSDKILLLYANICMRLFLLLYATEFGLLESDTIDLLVLFNSHTQIKPNQTPQIKAK